MSRACIVLFPPFDVPFLSMLSNSSGFPKKVVKRRSKSKSSWHGTGKTPAMISISKMETTVRTIIVNTNNALWRIMHILLNLDVWVTWKYIYVQVQILDVQTSGLSLHLRQTLKLQLPPLSSLQFWLQVQDSLFQLWLFWQIAHSQEQSFKAHAVGHGSDPIARIRVWFRRQNFNEIYIGLLKGTFKACCLIVWWIY